MTLRMDSLGFSSVDFHTLQRQQREKLLILW